MRRCSARPSTAPTSVHNPGGWDRFVDDMRRKAIGLLQRLRESRRLTFADA